LRGRCGLSPSSGYRLLERAEGGRLLVAQRNGGDRALGSNDVQGRDDKLPLNSLMRRYTICSTKVFNEKSPIK
jgi:hypothetical protein